MTNTLIKDFYHLRKYSGDCGIEIEIIGKNLPTKVTGWKVEIDGSLQNNGLEYVTRGGVNRDKIIDKLNSLKKALKESTIEDDVRAGVHVHVNVQDMTHTQLACFATLFYVFENLLLKFCGEYREGNLFCLRTDDADYIQRYLFQAFNRYNLKELYTDEIRYAACNWKPVTQYGSLEFRCMQSTEDLDLIHIWADMLLEIKEKSLMYNTPKDIIAEFSMQAEDDYIDKHLGDYARFFDGENKSELLRQGMYNAQDFAYEIPWETYEKTINQTVAHIKEKANKIFELVEVPDDLEGIRGDNG